MAEGVRSHRGDCYWRLHADLRSMVAAAPPFVVLMLLSEKAKSRSVGLLVGCVVGLGGAVAVGGFDQHGGWCAPRGVGAERVARAAGAPPRPLRGRATGGVREQTRTRRS